MPPYFLITRPPDHLLDPRIPWPVRVESNLTARKGWTISHTRIFAYGQTVTLPMMCRLELGVIKLVEAPGFALCLSHTGYPLSFAGRVFARCEDAMVATESLLESSRRWQDVESHGFDERHASLFRGEILHSERWGFIQRERYYPSVGATIFEDIVAKPCRSR